MAWAIPQTMSPPNSQRISRSAPGGVARGISAGADERAAGSSIESHKGDDGSYRQGKVVVAAVPAT